MTDKQKIELANLIEDFIKDNTKTDPEPVMIGVLNKAQGLNGFKKSEIGTPVFDDGQRYFIMSESLDGKINVKIPYYKETLSPAIDFGAGVGDGLMSIEDGLVSIEQYEHAIDTIGQLQEQLAEAEEYINNLSKGYEHE